MQLYHLRRNSEVLCVAVALRGLVGQSRLQGCLDVQEDSFVRTWLVGIISMLLLQVFIRNNCSEYIGCYSYRRQLHFELKVQLKMLVAYADL